MIAMAIKRALLSVSDKRGIVELARFLHDKGIEIISTGGTMKAIEDAGIPVTYVSDVTGTPEMMDGRVKTLNPKIHGGILAVRSNPKHMEDMKKNGIKPKPSKISTLAVPAWFGLRQRISTMWWSSRIRIAMPVS